MLQKKDQDLDKASLQEDQDLLSKLCLRQSGGDPYLLKSTKDASMAEVMTPRMARAGTKTPGRPPRNRFRRTLRMTE